MKHKICEVLAILTLFVMIALSAFWYFEKDPYSVYTIGMPIQKIPIGGTIAYERYICPSKEVEAKVQIEVVGNGSVYNFPDTVFSKQYCGVYTFSSKIPETIQAGFYEYRVAAKYNVNPMKNAIKQLETIYFEVTDNGN